MVVPGIARLIPLVGLIACALGAPPPAQQVCSPFDAATVQLDKDQPPFRRLADLDLDGDLDAIGAAISTDFQAYHLVAYENDGQGVFGQRTGVGGAAISTPGERRFLIEIGHLNADPYPDFTVLFGDWRLDWINQGNGFFQTTPGVFLANAALGLALAELDGDGRSEVLWVDSSKLHISTSKGAEVEIDHGASQVQGLHVLPKDGPVDLDVFLVAGLTKVRIHYGSAAYGFVADQTFSVGPMAKTCATGDVDGDGDVDAVLFLAGIPPRYRVLRRLAPASWAIEPAASGGPAEFLADVDGDGDLDGVCCGGGGGGGSTFDDNVRPTDFEIALNDGSGAFAPAFQIPGLGSPQLAGAVDVDGDGDTDLVAGRCVVYACGAIRPPVAEAPGFSTPPPRGPRDLSDCDGDGDVDVGFSVDAVFSNDGTGRFVKRAPAIQAPPLALEFRGPGFPGDFDGDSDVDLLVEMHGKVRRYGALPPLGMGLLENDGAGTLRFGGLASEPLVSFQLDSLEAEASLAVDADQDGDLDLVTRTFGAPAASQLWVNDGRGRFRAGGRLGSRRVEWVGDLDLDGDVDLLVSRPLGVDAEIGMFLGAPRGPGLPPFFVPDPRLCCWAFDPLRGGLAVGDPARDGYPDFAIARSLFGAYYEALGLYNVFALGGAIAANVSLDSGHDLGPGARISFGDVNGDGIDDALVGTHLEDPVTISEVHLKRTAAGFGYGTFSMTQQLLPTGLLVDLDTDGDLDLLGERIVFNRTYP